MAQNETSAGKATTFGGNMMTAYGQYKDAQAVASSMYFDADMLEMQAVDVLQTSELEAERARQAGKDVAGQQLAAQGASGVDVSFGSPAMVRDETFKEAEKDARLIKLNAARAAWGLRAQAAQKRYEGDMAVKAGKRAAISTVLGGVGLAVG